VIGTDIGKKVGIVGVGQTKYEEKKDQSIPEMVYAAVCKALDDAGLTINEIDNIVTASVDLWDGKTASNVLITEVVGAVMKTETRIAADGIAAAYHALMTILSGTFDVTLVVAHCKGSEGSHYSLTNWVFDPIYQQKLGLDYLSAAALQASWYMDKYGITEEQCAKVSVKNHRNALKNPYAQMPMNITVRDVLNSKILAHPIKHLDAAPVSDGACALILASDQRTKKISKLKGRDPAWIKGVGNNLDFHYLGDRDLTKCDGLILAARRTYQMAGIEKPLKDIDVAEVSEPFSYQELLWTEGLGFCKRGEGGRLIDEGVTEMGGELPVNPSGGMLAGNPYTVAGLTRLAEATLQVRGEAYGRQVFDARIALALGATGPCGQAQCVIIVGK